MLAPDQGAVSAGVEAMTISDHGIETSVADPTCDTAPATNVLQDINRNTGGGPRRWPRAATG